MITDWRNITPPVFEKLCAAVLGKCGFTNIQWFGETGNDKGRDIIAEKIDVPVPGVERRQRWLIQCKRYLKASLSKGELKELLDAALEHSVDSVLIIVTASVSANLRDWLSSACQKYPFDAYIWEELDFRRQVNALRSELLDAIPELTEGRQPLWMYPMNQNEIELGCNEFEEVKLVVWNVYTPEEAKAKAAEFLRYVHQNGFEWWD